LFADLINTLVQHNLPLLSSIQNINALLPAEMVAYIHGYNPGVVVPHRCPAHIHMIKNWVLAAVKES